MANGRSNRLRARIPGARWVRSAGSDLRERPTRIPGESAASARARRVAVDLADGVLVAVGTDTARHSRDVERIALALADRLGLSGDKRHNVGIAARLHDVGKIGIPRSLLEKAAAPTAKEWELIYSHTVIGERIMQSVEELRTIAPAVRHSHERWDGTGYPDGLRGEQIPWVSRIIFCADAFHAICTDRSYRRGRSMASALAEIRRCSGTQFEPRVVAALTRVVRDDIYGSRRPRRRSHARISTLLVVALSLAGSIAGGLAASREAASPGIPASAAVPTSAPAPRVDPAATQLAPALVPRGAVAGAAASFKLPNAGTGTRPDGSQARRDRAPGAPLPSLPVVPPSGIETVKGAAPHIGSKLGSAPLEGKPSMDQSDSHDPADGRKEPPGDARHLPGLDALRAG